MCAKLIISVVPKGYCSTIPFQFKGWTRCPFPSHASLPRSSYVVVHCCWSYIFRCVLCFHWNISNSTAHLGCRLWSRLIFLRSPSACHNSGNHKSANRRPSSRRASRWVHTSWKTHRQHRLQNDFPHDCYPVHCFRRWLEAWSLHENSSPHDVLNPIDSYRDRLYLGLCLARLAGLKYRRSLFAESDARIYMPWDDNFRDIICDLGSSWTFTYV